MVHPRPCQPSARLAGHERGTAHAAEPGPPIDEQLRRHARNRPDHPALAFGAQRLTYAELLRAVNAYRDSLSSRPAHASLALCRQSDPATLTVFLAAASLGSETQVLNPDWPEAMIRETLDALRPDLVVRDADPTHIACRAGRPASAAPRDRAGEAPFYTGFTSGSTGLPKGFRRSERSWLASFRADQAILELTPEDTVLVFGSLAHSLFLYAALRGLYAGATVILHPSFRPDRVRETIAAAGVSAIFGVPTHLDALAGAPGPTGPALRVAVSTGAKLSAGTIGALSSVFPNARIVECYGTSELSFVSAYTASGREPDGFVGWPLEGVAVQIRDAEGGLCPVGVAGNVHVTSPFLFMGYAGGGGGPAPGTPFCVGDRGYLDADGGLHLVGRSDRMFQCAGRNIVPEEIETALHGIAGIDHAAVIGEADSSRGNRIVAILRLSAPVERRTIVARLREALPAYAIPGRILRCREWPLTASHKTDFATLTSWIAAGRLKDL